jgi:hypothetical protein
MTKKAKAMLIQLKQEGFTHLCDCTIPYQEGCRPCREKGCNLCVELQSPRGIQILEDAIMAHHHSFVR